jgi:diguanylate cyclase (GGDEF)-like protein
MPGIFRSSTSQRAYLSTAVAALAIAIASALGIGHLQSRADRAGEVQLHLERLQSAATGAAAMLVVGERYPALKGFLSAERRDNRETIRAELEALSQNVGPGESQRVHERMERFLAETGRPDGRESVTSGLLGWGNFTASLAELRSRAASTTAVARRQATIGLWIILLGGAAIIILLVYRSQLARRRSEALEDAVSRDALTRLLNHAAFHKRFAELIAAAEATATPLALILADLDLFKQINDTHGHQVGDRVLVETAERLRLVSRAGDVVARIGGEEFAWILPGADRSVARASAERLRRAIGADTLSGDVGTTISVGVAVYEQGMSAEDLFDAADHALYGAKDDGRDRVGEAHASHAVSP